MSPDQINYFHSALASGTPKAWWEGVVQLGNLLAACIVAGTAVYGLSRWKTEAKAKRAMDLAEQILVAAYEARDVIDYMRAPFSPAEEQEKIVKGEDETEEHFRRRRTYSAANLRYQEHRDVFAKLQAIRYRAAALFGHPHRTALEDMLGLARKILSAASTGFILSRSEEAQLSMGHFDEAARLQSRREKAEAILGWGVEDRDDFAEKIEAAMKHIEMLYRPIAADGHVPRLNSSS